MVKCKQKEVRKKPKEEVWVVSKEWREEDAAITLFWNKEDAKKFFDKLVQGIKDEMDDEYVDDEDHTTDGPDYFWVSSDAGFDEECDVHLRKITIN